MNSMLFTWSGGWLSRTFFPQKFNFPLFWGRRSFQIRYAVTWDKVFRTITVFGRSWAKWGWAISKINNSWTAKTAQRGIRKKNWAIAFCLHYLGFWCYCTSHCPLRKNHAQLQGEKKSNVKYIWNNSYCREDMNSINWPCSQCVAS